MKALKSFYCKDITEFCFRHSHNLLNEIWMLGKFAAAPEGEEIKVEEGPQRRAVLVCLTGLLKALL